MGDYRKLKSWVKARELAVAVYRTTERLPATERFGLIDQMRRAVVSVASNIAEGVGRNRSTETAGFIRIALGSCTELECQLLLSQDLGYIDEAVAEQLLGRTCELRAMLASFHQRLLTHARPSHTSSPDS
ncbi:MAG: four helix bundle protein [Gemmatimonadales bacterium]